MTPSRNDRCDAAPHSGPGAGDDEIIVPLDAALAKPVKAAGSSRRRFFMPVFLFFVILLTLASGGVLLWYYLSRSPLPALPPPSPSVSLEQPAAAPPGPVTASPRAETVQDKAAAEQKLAAFLNVQKKLDALGASAWGKKAYAAVVKRASTADDYLVGRQYRLAARAYDEATAAAHELLNRSDAALQQLLLRGENCLQADNASGAQRALDLALMIDPGNAAARHNLARADSRPEVLQLLASGKRHEEQGSLALAHADFFKALELDPEYHNARNALERVNTQISGEQFQQLMSRGFAALYDDDYEQARSLFLKARTFKPDAPEVQDALAQTDAAIKLAKIERLRKQALTAETADKWEEALALYRSVLRIDSAIQFAAQGQARTDRLIQLERAMLSYLESPRALEKDQALEKALDLVAAAESFRPASSRLLHNAHKLQAAVDAARTPVPIIIESDSMTTVVIYKVGKLGRFETRELKLRPGTYTVVGTRNGYRDVRHSIVVQAGQSPVRVTVQCTEQI